jgi:acetyl-CoA carboxylase carboxyltransferase component
MLNSKQKWVSITLMQGKMEEINMGTTASAKRRIDLILDAGSFMELGENVVARSTDFNFGESKMPSDGILTGYGTLEGRPVYIYSQDIKVLGGSLAEMHASKILRIYEMAKKSGAPVIGLIDCEGLRLQEGADALNSFGRIYKAQTQAKGVIPQITAIFDHCGGGMTFVAALSDFVFVQNDASVFVNPAATRSVDVDRADMILALNNNPAGETLSDGRGDENDICESIRNLISYLPLSFQDIVPEVFCEDDLNRALNQTGSMEQDVLELVSQIADLGSVFEVAKMQAKDAVTCFARFNGRTVGVLANSGDGYLTSAACEKMAEFADFCAAFNLPILTLTNAKGFSTENKEEMMMPKSAAYLLSVFASATVPKVNVIIGEALGNAYTVMNSKGLGADFVFAWENAKIQVMPEEEAAQILYADELSKASNKRAFLVEKAEEYRKQGGVGAFLSRGYIEKVIAPVDTRKYIIGALEILSDKREY